MASEPVSPDLTSTPGATSPAAFADFLRAVRPEVEAALDQLLPAAEEPPARLHEALRYAIFAGGKRVRPALVVAMPVGFVSAAESKDLIASQHTVPWMVIRGRKGGSTLVVADGR